MITVYAYDANTKEYLGTTQAQESPLEPGITLMPSNSTAIQPPSVEEKQVAVWNGEGWNTVTDLRNTVYYDADGKEYTQKELGNMPEWALLEKPVIPEPEEPEKQLGQLTLGYIAKLNTLYPTLNLLATDTIEEARVKLETAGVEYPEVSTLITFYDKRW